MEDAQVVPDQMFAIIKCCKCEQTWAVLFDPATGNWVFWNSKFVGRGYDPDYVVAASNMIGCPEPGCDGDFSPISGCAVLTADGEWLYLDKRPNTALS